MAKRTSGTSGGGKKPGKKSGKPPKKKTANPPKKKGSKAPKKKAGKTPKKASPRKHVAEGNQRTHRTANRRAATPLHDADFEPFAVTPTEIANLDPLRFRRFVTDLLMHEVLAYGGEPGDVVGNPGDVPDDGQDALTNRRPRPTDGTDFFIPIGETVWQFKAEARAPTPAEFREEIRKPRPQVVLAAGGSYHFVAQQPSVNETTKAAQLKVVAGAGAAARVHFSAQDHLSRRARRFPVVVVVVVHFIHRAVLPPRPPTEFLPG